MFRLKTVILLTMILFTCDVIAEDVYISGGDSAALQAAVDAANVLGSQVTIHLEAGQTFQEIPSFSKFAGNMTIEGNGAIWLAYGAVQSIAPEGVVTLTGITYVNPLVLSASCYYIRNQGRLTLDRVSFSNFVINASNKFTVCEYPRELLLNEGSAKLVNVTIVGSEFPQIRHYLIYTSENASTEISQLTVADNLVNYSWESGDFPNSILITEPGGETSISNSIILANANLEDRVTPCVGPITDNGGNFSSSGDCGFSGGLIDRDDLGQIIEKGHDAWVMPLLPGSVAVNAGNPDYCQKLDGRGFERGVLCDSGSYETAASNHGGELGRGGVSGFYYTPETDGNYIQVQRAYDGNVVVIWNTFDTSGAQAWINAVGSYQDGVIMAGAYRNLGGVFQPGGSASGGTETDWGTLKVTAHDCNHITVEYESSDPEFGSGTFEAERIAYVHDMGCSE